MNEIPQKLVKAAKRFKLSPRQFETLSLLAAGEPWKGVADKMSISISTVRVHAQNICRKTGAPSVCAAIGKIFIR